MFFGRLRIQGKLTLLVLVPLIGVVALATPIVADQVGEATRAQRTADAVALADRVGSLLQEMQEERLLSVGYLLNVVERSELVLQSADVIDRLTAVARDMPIEPPPALVAALGSARSLQNTRTIVLDRKIEPNEVITEFSTVITPLIDGLELNRRADLTTSQGRQVLALDRVLRNDEAISQSATLLAVTVGSGDPALVTLISQRFAELQSDVQGTAAFATPSQMELYEQVQNAFTARAGANFFETLVADPALAVKGLTVASLFPSLESIIVLGRFVQKKITSDVREAVTQSRNRAYTTALAVCLVTLLLVAIVVMLSLLVARAVARPLRRLTTSADRMARAAQDELQRVADDETEAARPLHLDPVAIQAADEIGDLARAFERVQATAVSLVERQTQSRRNVAQMFGHVGRRTQNLVGRQLALIDRLERQETDSSRLRELYRLDHVSSRLRRNASSLVVLSGGTGTDDHMAPMPLADVVRLALGEIEDYVRVDIDVPAEAIVAPAVVGDLTLLLAELMENATSFSPPHTRVEVSATLAGPTVRLGVVDHGLGLAPDRLADENARLARRERLDLAPTEVLGLFVVGRLARRHGLTVQLAGTPGGGVTATVELGERHLLPAPVDLHPLVAHGQLLPADAPVALSAGPPRGRASVDEVTARRDPFDPAALTRVSETLESAGSWNAFVPRQQQPAARARSTGFGPAPTRPTPVTPAVRLPASPAATPVRGQASVAAAGLESRALSTTLPAPVEPPGNGVPAHLPRQRDNAGPAGLRRRVPGSQLPVDHGGRVLLPPSAPADAQAARTMLDDFEAGVSRAQQETAQRGAAGGLPPATRPAAPPPAVAAAPPPPANGLVRRVPGATLSDSAFPSPAKAPPPRPAQDPDEARKLIEQFESGVALALSETRPDQEGPAR